jgi:hypothetical protein
MPKIGPWSRRKPLISWEKLGTEALNNYLLISWAGRDSSHRINVMGSGNGIDFGNKHTLNDTSDYTPTLARCYGSLGVVWTGRDSRQHLNVMTL